MDWWVRAYTIATIFGVCGGLIGLRLIWREIKATEDAAEAALLSAKSLKNAERAHLDAELIHAGTEWKMTVTNNGNSVAIVDSSDVGRTYMPRGWRELPDKFPQFSDPFSHRQLIPRHCSPRNIITFKIEDYLTADVMSGEQAVLFSGHVEYIDIFGDHHKTMVVYRYVPSTNTLELLPQYIRYE